MMIIRSLRQLMLAICSTIVLASCATDAVAPAEVRPAPAAAQQAPAAARATPAAPAPAAARSATPATPPAATPRAGTSNAALVASNPQYRLAAGDSIKISVFQAPELSVETRLTESGNISYPLLGNVQLGGLSVSEAEKRISDGLRSGNYVKQPQVTVLVMQVRGHQVTVLGQVGRPGRYPLETASVRVTEMLATAGGVQPTGADTVVVTGTRNGQQFRTEVDLPAVYSGKVTSDIQLQNGDSIFVDRAPMVYVEGEVGRPGPVRLERNMTVRQAIAAAGGITLRGTERGLKVHRRDSNGRIQEVTLRMTDALLPEDVIHVRESLF